MTNQKPISFIEIAEIALQVQVGLHAACTHNPLLRPASTAFAQRLTTRNPDTNRVELGGLLLQQGATIGGSVSMMRARPDVYDRMAPGMLYISDVMGVAGLLLWMEDADLG